jgi:PleD family two-component response regulator
MSYLLLVDDDESTRFVVRKILELAGYEVEPICDGPSALASVSDREPELIVLDYSMPVMNGIEVCHAIKHNPLTAHIPVLMLTAMDNIDCKVEGFQAGADDYLAKPFESRELLARVEALLRLVRRASDRNPTSGLPGGRAIQEEIALRATQDTPFAICYMDLDNFKPFADTFGFAMADTIISETGAAVRSAAETVGGPNCFAGHIGGDDFIVVTTKECAEPIARECAARFDCITRRTLGEETVRCGKFVGIDRDGQTREYPISRLSATVLTIDPVHAVSIGHIGAFAADLKRRAKQYGAGTILTQSL